jgi:AcrR family transcriptional regulator
MRNSVPAALYQQARAARTRVGILGVAVDLASAEGLEGLSIGRLATELRMSKTGIFAHFGSKEQLQLATVGAAKEVFLEQVVKPSLDNLRGLPRLKAMLES